MLGHLFGKVEVVVEPLAGIDTFDIQAGGTVGQWRKEAEPPDSDGQNGQSNGPSGEERFAAHALLGRHEPTQTAARPGPLGLARRVVHGGRSGTRVEGLQIEDKLDKCASYHG